MLINQRLSHLNRAGSSCGNCPLCRTSATDLAWAHDHSSPVSPRSPDPVGATGWALCIGLNKRKGPYYRAWAVAPCVELGWGIHRLHWAQSPCLIAAYYTVVLPHLLFGEGIVLC